MLYFKLVMLLKKGNGDPKTESEIEGVRARFRDHLRDEHDYAALSRIFWSAKQLGALGV